jgi:hypothetical protein
MITQPFRRALLAGGLSLLCTAASAATTYTYTLVTVPGTIETYPTGLNDAGTMVGFWDATGYVTHGFTFAGGKVTSFDPPGSISTYPTGINKKGDIVGSYADTDGNYHGFILSAAGKYTTIDLPGSAYTDLNAINNDGVVVGEGQDASGNQELFTYSGGKFTTILDNGLVPIAIAINDAGDVAGYYSANSRPTETAFLYKNGTATVLPLKDFAFSQPYGMNKQGVVVGQYLSTSSANQYGFIYNTKGKVKYIGETTDSFNLAINDKNVVAGVSFTPGSYSESVGYTYEKGTYSTLQFKKGSNFAAVCINNAGLVAGSYVDSNNISQVFLATPKS